MVNQSSPDIVDADKSALVEELDIYIKSAERYERGDADFQKALPAVTLKVLRAEINALARLRETYSDLFVEHQNVVASRDAWRGRAEQLEAPQCSAGIGEPNSPERKRWIDSVITGWNEADTPIEGRLEEALASLAHARFPDPAQRPMDRNAIIEECAHVAEQNYALMFTKQENRDTARKVSAQIVKGIRGLLVSSTNCGGGK